MRGPRRWTDDGTHRRRNADEPGAGSAGRRSAHAGPGRGHGGVPVTPEERAEFRAFVRDHHPDRGGDPEVFAAGLARFRGADPPPDTFDGHDQEPAGPVGPFPLPVRVGVALIRTWRRHRGGTG